MGGSPKLSVAARWRGDPPSIAANRERNGPSRSRGTASRSPSSSARPKSHDCILLRPTREQVQSLVPDEEAVTIHLDAGYASAATRQLLDDLGYAGEITPKGTQVAIQRTSRWVVERTNSWHTRGFGKLAICTGRRIRVLAAFVALANAMIIIRRLLAEAWTRYRGEARPTRRP